MDIFLGTYSPSFGYLQGPNLLFNVYPSFRIIKALIDQLSAIHPSISFLTSKYWTLLQHIPSKYQPFPQSLDFNHLWSINTVEFQLSTAFSQARLIPLYSCTQNNQLSLLIIQSLSHHSANRRLTNLQTIRSAN